MFQRVSSAACFVGFLTAAFTCAPAPADAVVDAPADTKADAPADTKPDAPAQCTDAGDCTGTVAPECYEVYCNAGTCDTQPVSDGTSCDDGEPCSDTDECTAGVCKGSAVQCGVNG